MSARDTCPLCGLPLAGAPSVAIRGGGRCHLACAETQAAATWRQRRGQALAHLAIIVIMLLALAWWAGASPALIVVALAWGALHAWLHRRWWHYTARDLRRVRRGR